MRRLRGPRIIRPGVFGVAAFHFFFDFGVGAFPEAFEVLCDLQWAATGGEQVQGEGNAAGGDAWGIGEAEEFLEFHRQHRGVAVAVMDRAFQT